MYFRCICSVVIGNKQVKTVHSVSVKNDAKEIGSSCKVVVPLACRIQYTDGTHDFLTDLAKNLFNVGDAITVTAYYIDQAGNQMPTIQVFQGYVYEFMEGTPLTIECLDSIYLLNQTSINVVYKSITVRNLLTNILKGTGITLALPTVDLTLVNLTFRLMSPAAVLQWIKEQLGLNISLTGGQLYCNIASNTVNQAFLDTERNVIESKLQKPNAVYLRLKVKAWFIQETGKKYSLEVGDANGELREVFFYRLPLDIKRYTQLAGEALIKYKQMKFNGQVETYLYPDMGLFWKVQYIDFRYPDRNGNYTVVGMDFTLDEKGFHRHLKLSFLSDIDSDVNALGSDNNIINLQP